MLNTRGHLLDLSSPCVMGILNITPDSFYDGGVLNSDSNILAQAEKMLQDGATILDLGGASSRPGAAVVSEDEELRRVVPAVELLVKTFPEAILSIDTWRAKVARECINAGGAIINDISGGSFDPDLFATVAELNVPYILMHLQGTPETMHQVPQYDNVTVSVLDYFIEKLGQLRALGVKDIILDPGFGFGKTLANNYTLLNNLNVFQTVLGLPVLAGLSRKSMISKLLQVETKDALNGTTALNMVALQNGANILRVHDVKEAAQTIKLWQMLNDTKSL